LFYEFITYLNIVDKKMVILESTVCAFMLLFKRS